jgi:hypothetical protein
MEDEEQQDLADQRDAPEDAAASIPRHSLSGFGTTWQNL